MSFNPFSSKKSVPRHAHGYPRDAFIVFFGGRANNVSEYKNNKNKNYT